MDLRFRIPIVSGIPDSYSCIPAQGSGFHKQKFPGFPYIGRHLATLLSNKQRHLRHTLRRTWECLHYTLYIITLYIILFTLLLIIVLSSTVAPKLTLKSQNQTVNESDTITLLCVATGDPNPNITWTKGSTVVQQTSISNYTISSAAKDDSGTYTCTAQVTVPGLSVQPDNYQVTLTVRCKYSIDPNSIKI